MAKSAQEELSLNISVWTRWTVLYALARKENERGDLKRHHDETARKGDTDKSGRETLTGTPSTLDTSVVSIVK